MCLLAEAARLSRDTADAGKGAKCEGFELVALYTIHDKLGLNELMPTFPIEAIKI